MNDIYQNNEWGGLMKYGKRNEPTVLGTIGAFFQLLWSLIQLAFWGAIVVGIIYLIVKIIF